MIGSRISAISFGRRELRRVVDVQHRAVGARDFVDHGRRAGDQVELVFALEPLLHDVHVQQPQETAAEAEAQRGRDFRLVVQRRVVELELGERVAKAFVVFGVDRKHAGEHARLHLLEARQRLPRPGAFSAVIVSPTGAPSISLMPATTKPTSPALSSRMRHRLGREAPELVDLVAAAGRHDADLLAGAAARR